jgi:hypothetical protein
MVVVGGRESGCHVKTGEIFGCQKNGCVGPENRMKPNRIGERSVQGRIKPYKNTAPVRKRSTNEEDSV